MLPSCTGTKCGKRVELAISTTHHFEHHGQTAGQQETVHLLRVKPKRNILNLQEQVPLPKEGTLLLSSLSSLPYNIKHLHMIVVVIWCYMNKNELNCLRLF